MKFKYLYQQLISHISVLVVAFLVLSILFAHYVETLVLQNKVDELKSYGENILTDLTTNPVGQNQVMNQYSEVLGGRSIRFSVFNQKGVSINPSERHAPMITFSEKEWDKFRNGEPIVKLHDLKRFDQEVTFVVLPYLVGGQFIGGILLTSPISGSAEMISEIHKYLWYAVLIALAVSALLSWLLSRIHVNRIKRIRDATSLVSSGNYSIQLPSSNFDEIGQLASDFNQMVGKLNTSMEEIESLENRRRNFMADVAHEMRTPLTTISGVIEGLRNNMIADEEKEKGIQLVSQESKRLIRLVNENLDYDKIRSNQVKLMCEDIQLMDVLEIIKDQLDFQAEANNNQIILEVDESVMIYADYDRLVQILINITKNSIQFTTDGTIWLRGKAGYKETIIEIEDTGIGIDPAEVENIWHRFYKADISRTSTPYGEFGLGLSIVKKLVQLHHGEINVTSKKGKGTKFEIRFPQRSSVGAVE